MTIVWYGETCLAIEGEGGTLLVNPYPNLKKPKGPVDVLVFTEETPPRSSWEHLVGSETIVIDTPGEYDVRGFFILVFDHIALIQENGRVLAHLAQGAPELSADDVERLGKVDILALRIGQNIEEAIQIVNQIEPATVIPMPTNSSIDKFLKEFGAAKIEPQKKFVIRKNQTLPSEETEVVVLAPV